MAIHRTFNEAFIEGSSWPAANIPHVAPNHPTPVLPWSGSCRLAAVLGAFDKNPRKLWETSLVAGLVTRPFFEKHVVVFVVGVYPVVDISWVWSKQNFWQNSDRPCSRCRVSERLVTVCRLEVFCYVAVGWDGHIFCACVHMVDAKQLWRLHTWSVLRHGWGGWARSLLVHTWSMPRSCDVGVTCTHGRCYTMLGGAGAGRSDIDELLDSWIPCSVNTE